MSVTWHESCVHGWPHQQNILFDEDRIYWWEEKKTESKCRGQEIILQQKEKKIKKTKQNKNSDVNSLAKESLWNPLRGGSN